MLEVTVPFELTRYLAPQGSVSLDGVSLTVVAVDRDRFRVALIPHTVATTTLGRKGQGASVNVEVDVISKYVERHMAARAARPAFQIFDEQPKERTEPEVRVAPPTTKPRPATPSVSSQRKPMAPAGKTASKRVVEKSSATKRPTAKPAKRRR